MPQVVLVWCINPSANQTQGFMPLSYSHKEFPWSPEFGIREEEQCSRSGCTDVWVYAQHLCFLNLLEAKLYMLSCGTRWETNLGCCPTWCLSQRAIYGIISSIAGICKSGNWKMEKVVNSQLPDNPFSNLDTWSLEVQSLHCQGECFNR
jgi:hypothetical protein